MPYSTHSKNKTQTTKNKKIKVLKKINLMRFRLLVISRKVDGYIYKKKPISTQKVDKYARELDVLRNQCSDERDLQVIGKLTSYMKCLIKEQSQKDISNTMRNTVEEFNGENIQDNRNAIVDIEMEKALSNLSIVEDLQDPLDITDKNDNECYQKKLKILNSTSTVTKENLNENNNTEKENNSNEIDVSELKVISRKQIEIADDIDVNSQNILSNFEYKNYISLGSLRNYRKIHNKQIQETIDDKNKNTVSDNTKIENHTNKPDSNNLNDKHQKEKEIDRDSILSANLLGNFEYGNFSAAHQNNLNPINYQPRNDNEVDIIADTRNIVNNYNIMNTENKNTTLNVNNIKEKFGDSNKLSQNLLINFESDKTTVGTLQNNTNSNNYQSQQNIGSYCTNKDYTITKTNQIQYQLPQPNLTAFMPSILNITTLNNIEPSKKDQRNNLIHNPSQNEMHIIDKVRKQRKTPKKDTAKTKIKRKCNRKNKVNNVDVTTELNNLSKQTVKTNFHDAKNLEKLVNTSAKKNKSKLLKKKRIEVDMSWVENMKFARVIEREEYVKMDDLEESFWSDLTLPLNTSVTDFECDNINIWKN